MMEVTIWIAFGAGLISFLSPCIFPLVPAYSPLLFSGDRIPAKKQWRIK